MQLEEIIAIVASNLLAGSVNQRALIASADVPNDVEIEAAITTAKKIWLRTVARKRDE